MKKSIAVAALLAMAALPGIANAKPAHHHHRHVAQRVVQSQRQIACTVIGCVPVPPGCGQTAGKTFGGMPTGGDVIVCPPGVAPFR